MEESLDSMADEIFELYRLIAIARARRPAGSDDLSEHEFLTLDALYREEPQNIGEVQRSIGVVPAQMSRIVRAMETQGGKGFLECRINPSDRRRIDLVLTEDGRAIYEQFKHNRVGSMKTILKVLQSDDRAHFMRILRQLRAEFSALVG